MWIITAVPLLLAVLVNRLVVPALDAATDPSVVEAAAPRRLAILGIGLALGITATWARHRMAEDRRLTPFAVGVWIACLPFLDAMMLVALDAWPLAGLCALCVPSTLLGQLIVGGRVMRKNRD
jgi:hypothetical protein